MNDLESAYAYAAISAFYQDRVTKRHAIRMMDHIDHGVIILRALGVGDETIAAFMLHPMFQSDEELYRNRYLLESFSSTTVSLVMEYRNIANQGLRGKTPPAELKIPLIGVVHMLIADKVQNRWSFEHYHLITHPETDALAKYFDDWMNALTITAEEYREFTKLFAPRSPNEQLRSPPPTHPVESGPADRMGKAVPDSTAPVPEDPL